MTRNSNNIRRRMTITLTTGNTMINSITVRRQNVKGNSNFLFKDRRTNSGRKFILRFSGRIVSTSGVPSLRNTNMSRGSTEGNVNRHQEEPRNRRNASGRQRPLRHQKTGPQ